VIHEKVKDLLIENEYGIEYTDYWKRPDEDLVKFTSDNFNINLDCHNICLNCQIEQVDKYSNADAWNVKVSKAYLYADENIDEPVGVLRKFQRVKLIQRKGDIAHVSTVVHYGVCMRDQDHAMVYREKKSHITQLRCEECDSGFSARSKKIEGWLPFKQLTAFVVKCDFIPRDYEQAIPADLKARLNDDQQEALLSVMDPVRWSRDLLGIELREHQKIDAMCSAKHTVRRWGRRSGKTFIECVKVLRYALTKQIHDGYDSEGKAMKRGPVILIISPFLAQIAMIFDQIKQLIVRNPDIHKVRDVKTPFHEIVFADTPTCKGAIIRGFTTGSQSGAEGGTIRGQSADLILLDEVDAMPEDDIVKAVQPIQATTPNVVMMASSTPMGKQEWFWKQCTQVPHFKETYFPSTVLDHWDDIKDEIEQEGLTDARFLQEYMAKFITQIEGVYQPMYISEAELPYEYGQENPVFWEGNDIYINRPMPGWTYSIGVDWNTNAGVEICVVGLPAERVEFWVCNMVNVPKHEYQQHEAMDVIIKLNRFWNPSFIYVDRGYGGTQVEALQIYSETQRAKNPGSPDAQLKDILKAYDFSHKLKYRNPATMQIEESFAKPFMIQNSVRQFEQCRVKFSNKDFMLHNQLHNYIEEGKTPTGIPRYGMNDEKIGDHRLDALNLALIAYVLEMSDYSLNSGVCTRMLHVASFGAERVKRVIAENERNWIEFVQNLPPNTGIPGRMKVRYDPGYVAMKEAEGSGRVGASRTEALDKAGRSYFETDTLRLGFGSDTEWKHTSSRLPTSRVARIRSSKPKRRSF
jgi:hypothetical protein